MLAPTKYALFIPAILLLISSCGSKESVQTEPSGPSIAVAVQPVNTNDCASEIKLSGTVNAATTDIIFNQSGVLEKGEVMLAERTTFTKGQLLCQINNKGAYKELTTIKKEVIAELNALMPEIKRTLPYKAIDKWKAFIEALKPVSLLPAYPSTNLPEEKDLVKLKTIGQTTYKEALALESKMKDFFYIAPFDGSISWVQITEGENVKTGDKVATLINTSGQQLEVAMTKGQLKAINKTTKYSLLDAKGKSVGTATFKSSTLSDGGKTAGVFAIQAAKGQKISGGSKLTVQLQGNAQLPCTTVDPAQICHDSVQIVQNGQIMKMPVKVLGREGGRVRVSGLVATQAILVDPYEIIPGDIRFVASGK